MTTAHVNSGTSCIYTHPTVLQVHSTLDGSDAADFKFTVKFNSREHSVAVRRRPFLFEFLERVAQLYEVVVFTASQKVYAEQLLNILDPQRCASLATVIKHAIVNISNITRYDYTNHEKATIQDPCRRFLCCSQLGLATLALAIHWCWFQACIAIKCALWLCATCLMYLLVPC